MHITMSTEARKIWVKFKLDPPGRPYPVRTRHWWSQRGGNTHNQAEPKSKFKRSLSRLNETGSDTLVRYPGAEEPT